MGGFAWVTLATNDSYSLGALVLAHSLKQAGTAHQLVVLVTPGVTASMREKLSTVFSLVQEVNILDSKDELNLRLLKRPELGITFTKLHCWRLTQFDKCVFLDADTLVLKNCDELFDREELSAAPDVGWPDCFNSGVFVYRPSNETYEKLVQFALEKGSFDGGDQGLLNLYFSDWATKDISKHLPFIYNLSSTATYSYLPAFKQFGINAKIIHFIGNSKPWLQYFNTETRQVQSSPDLSHLEGILQHWWNIFCSLVHPNLTSDMARSTSDVAHTSISSRTSQHNDKTELYSSKNVIWDPWEEYDKKQSAPQVPEITNPGTAVPSSVPAADVEFFPVPTHERPPFHHPSGDTHTLDYVQEVRPVSHIQRVYVKPVESHNTNAYDAGHVHNPPVPRHPESSQYRVPSGPRPSSFEQTAPTPQQCVPSVTGAPSTAHNHTTEPPSDATYSSQVSQQNFELVSCLPKPQDPSPPVQSNESEAATTVCKETTLHTNLCEDETDGGLAGAFAQLTLGTPRTAEQSALDDHLRRQGWEVGNIDYMGRDSFDNIWSKICETLSAGTQTESPSTSEATRPSPSDTALNEKTVREASSEIPEKEVSKSTPTASTLDANDSPVISPDSQIVLESSASVSLKQSEPVATDSVTSQPETPVKDLPSTEMETSTPTTQSEEVVLPQTDVPQSQDAPLTTDGSLATPQQETAEVTPQSLQQEQPTQQTIQTIPAAPETPPQEPIASLITADEKEIKEPAVAPPTQEVPATTDTSQQEATSTKTDEEQITQQTVTPSQEILATSDSLAKLSQEVASPLLTQTEEKPVSQLPVTPQPQEGLPPVTDKTQEPTSVPSEEVTSSDGKDPVCARVAAKVQTVPEQAPEAASPPKAEVIQTDPSQKEVASTISTSETPPASPQPATQAKESPQTPSPPQPKVKSQSATPSSVKAQPLASPPPSAESPPESVLSSPPTAEAAPEASPSEAGALPEAKAADETEQPKKSSAGKTEAAATLPTPPPRKTGGKKIKSKK